MVPTHEGMSIPWIDPAPTVGRGATKVGAFTIATARRNGEEVKLPTNAVMDAVIEAVSQGIESGEVTQASDLTVMLSAGERRSLLLHRKAVQLPEARRPGSTRYAR